ncbi:Putative uncharacterized protein [Taphrina deformans PYCC 5710]|uniref:Uncharacterized protein n=1 Tax=Taphrina deformans (strain PYCC 5710 / ATCC 11124 / CBS 356.35 / IMI 108563 / JCM 9778 / NBRC 8474) TaxID=1097556 RepID=R4X8A7_TAPDE|nr:Putative uncharacterized protein [Taphrina deformans PYCC 5710]|eukprot:CCG81773.1 Putative uncharacterized protein [Taphrina deformans PYCC 5710]
MADHDIDTTDLKRALLITTPRLLGYSFNPVSFHYVYDTNDRLRVVVLEVNNTFGEKHVYVLQQDLADEVPRKGYTSAQTFPRRFHVSPFNDRSGSYRLQCLDPLSGDEFKVSMHLTLLDVDGTKKLTAQVESTFAPVETSRTGSSVWTLVKYGSAVFLTMPRILLQAYKIHYGKKLAVYLRPEPYEDIGAIGRSQASPVDSYFADLVFEYLRTNAEWLPCHRIIFNILPSPKNRQNVVIDGAGFEDQLEITVLSWSFFSSLVTSESPLTCLWTDSLALSSPLFRTSDQTLFLRTFGAGFGRRLGGKWYLQDARVKYRGRPDWFEQVGEVEPDHTEFLGTSNCVFDNHVYDMAAKGRRSLWTFRYHVLSSLWLAWFGNTLFGAIATFAGDAGKPADEWLRVKLEFERRRLCNKTVEVKDK